MIPASKTMANVERKRLDFGDWFWLIWIVAFLALEIPAAIWKREWTFSHHVWKWFDVDKTPTWWRWLALVGFLVGIVVHFAGRWSAWYFAIFIPFMLVSLISYYRKGEPVKQGTQIARLVSTRPDLPDNIVEVTNPPYSVWHGVLKSIKPLIGPALLAAFAVLLQGVNAEFLVNLGSAVGVVIPLALASVVVEFIRNLVKQKGWAQRTTKK